MELRILRKPVGPGTIVQIKGERGMFTVKSISTSAAGLISVNCVGGPAGHAAWRSFRPERVKKVLPPRE